LAQGSEPESGAQDRALRREAARSHRHGQRESYGDALKPWRQSDSLNP